MEQINFGNNQVQTDDAFKIKYFQMNIASFIDHTVLKQDTRLEDVEKLIAEASENSFAAVCVPPSYVAIAAQKLKNTPVKVATVVGFPFGYTYGAVKAAEAKQALENGAQEIDMVINIGALKNKQYAVLEEEVELVLKEVRKAGALLKVIIESGILTDDEILKCCEIYTHYKVDFLKTSTGFAEKGASVHAVELLRKNLPASIQIKASGGIRDYHFAAELVRAGATRLGCSAGIAIVKGGSGQSIAGY